MSGENGRTRLNRKKGEMKRHKLSAHMEERKIGGQTGKIKWQSTFKKMNNR